MWYERRDLAFMFVDGASDLKRRQHESAGSVEHEVDWNRAIGHVDGAQHFFRIVHIDVAIDREPEDTHHLLSMDKQDDAGFPLSLNSSDEALS
jgi:hypothetical protein